MRARAVLTATCLLLAGAASVSTAGASAAAEPAPEVALRPADGVFQLEGKGWGHGRGLNQWGAQGAATQGVTATKILETYYPGTQPATLADRPVRVWLEEDDEVDVAVAAAAGLQVRDLATGTVMALPAGPDRWRVTRDAAGQHLASGDGTTWTPFPVGGSTTSAGPLRFEGTATQTVLLPGASRVTVRGTVTAAPLDSTRLATVNTLGLEQYLYSVVPSEAPASWHAQALQAQSVAARTYSLRKISRASASAPYDICSTVQCQVYKGMVRTSSGGTVTSVERPSTTAAVDATRGEVRTHQGEVILAEFSSSNGGHSTGSSLAYQVAKPDPWDAVASPHHLWTARLTAAAVERAFPAVGRLERLTVTGRDGLGTWGGRVKTVLLEGTRGDGTATRVTTTGSGIYQLSTWPGVTTGLRGTWWRVTTSAAQQTLTARAEGAPAGDTVRADGSVALPTTGTASLRLSWTNTGTATWKAGEVALAPSGPRGRTSPSRATSWPDATRAGTLAADVAPGGTGTFTLTLAGNGLAQGRSTETFEPVLPGTAWLGAPRTIAITRHDPAAARAAVLETTPAPPPPLVAYPGPEGRATVTVRLRNTGGQPWPLGGADVGGGDRLSTAVPEPLRTAAWSTPELTPELATNTTDPAASEVRPGEVGEWRVPVDALRAPPGTRELLLRAHDGTAAYGPEVRVPVTVRAATLAAARVAVTPAAPVVPSPRYVKVVVEVRNTGDVAWPVGVGSPVRLATVGNRPSPSANAGWLSPAQPAAVATNATRPGAATVAPGETARFALWLSGNGRPAGRVTETFTVLWHGWRYSGLRLPVAYAVR